MTSALSPADAIAVDEAAATAAGEERGGRGWSPTSARVERSDAGTERTGGTVRVRLRGLVGVGI